MKTLFASLAAVAALSVAGAAAAADCPLNALKPDYVQGSVGVATQANRDNGTAFSVAAGRKVGAVRAEIEYASTREANDAALGNVSSDAVNLNVYYDLKPIRGVTPFVGTGVGYVDLGGAGVRGDDNGLTFNFAAGAVVPVRDKLSLVAQYRYTVANDIKVNKGVGQVEDYRAGAATVGLRYTF